MQTRSVRDLGPLCCLLMIVPAVVAAAEPGGARVEPPAQAPSQPWFPKAPPLPAPTGEVIRVSTVSELFQAAKNVKPGGTILVADGHYLLPGFLELRTDRVTLRGASGDRGRVVLDGAQSHHGELVWITACTGVTIADLSIQNIKWNGFKINSETGVQELKIYNCVIHNIWQRGLKGVAVPQQNREKLRPRGCRVQYCLFYNDRPKQFADDPADTAANFGGNYVGGIDVMFPTQWIISDNVFVGIRGRTGGARGAVFLWHDARECLVERNLIIDCDSGICLGNSHKPEEIKIHCTLCVVRNNFLTGGPENGILADYTRNCTIAQNTVHNPNSRLQRLIRLVHDNDGLLVVNNLLSGPAMRVETASEVESVGNVAREVTGAFVDAQAGNLHLRAAVPGVSRAAKRLEVAPEDIDRQARGDPTDVGADEAQSSAR